MYALAHFSLGRELLTGFFLLMGSRVPFDVTEGGIRDLGKAD